MLRFDVIKCPKLDRYGGKMIQLYFEHANNLMDGIEIAAEGLHFEIAKTAKDADFIVSVVENDANALEVSLNGKTAAITYGYGKAKYFGANDSL